MDSPYLRSSVAQWSIIIGRGFVKSSKGVKKCCCRTIAGVPVDFKTWWGHQYMMGIISPPPLVGIGIKWLQKIGRDQFPCSHAHRCTCICILCIAWIWICNQKARFLVCTLGDSGFFRFQGIKVLWRLQFLEYLRILSLKFQMAQTKIEVVLSLSCWLSQFSNLTLKRKQFCTPREGNPENVLLISRNCLKYFYQRMYDRHTLGCQNLERTPV